MLDRRAFLRRAGAGMAGAAMGAGLVDARQAWAQTAGGQRTKQPNIVLILADDMGYSDIGCYGGEIDTPNLNALAAKGLRFTQFYNTARCCPTRASLMTGLHPAQAGIGWMTRDSRNPDAFDWGTEGYRGVMNRECVTLAEVLKTADYHTYMAGKWHLGLNERDMWPTRRGFDRFYGILEGASNYFQPSGPRGLTLDEEPIGYGENYYTTDAFTDYAIRFVKEQQDDRPFFLFLSYTAPHWPLHAKQEDVAKFRGRYKQGWEYIRKTRYERMKEMGLVRKEWPMAPSDAVEWESLTPEKRDEMDLRMATYAAQVHSMDYNIGRLVKTLERAGKLDNTLVLFLSDNGGCAEGDMLGGGKRADINRKDGPMFVTYGQAWANASNTPYRRYKHYVHEGGIGTPLIAHWPAGIKHGDGKLTDEPGYLPDLMATFVDLAGFDYPRTYNGHEVPPMEGKSLAEVFRTGRRQGHEYMFWHHEGHGAVRKGKWKAIRHDENSWDWELYDIDADRTEQHDLAADHPELVRELSENWYEWAWEHKVYPQRLYGDDRPVNIYP